MECIYTEENALHSKGDTEYKSLNDHLDAVDDNDEGHDGDGTRQL